MYILGDERLLLYPLFNSTYSWHSTMWHLWCVTLTAWFNKWWLFVKKIKTVLFGVWGYGFCPQGNSMSVLVLHPCWFSARRLLRPGVKFCVNATFIIDDKCVCVHRYLSEFTFHFLIKATIRTTSHHTHSASKPNDFCKSLCSEVCIKIWHPTFTKRCVYKCITL